MVFRQSRKKVNLVYDRRHVLGARDTGDRCHQRGTKRAAKSRDRAVRQDWCSAGPGNERALVSCIAARFQTVEAVERHLAR